MVTRVGGRDCYFPTALHELLEQIKVKLVRAASRQPRHDQEQAWLGLDQPIRKGPLGPYGVERHGRAQLYAGEPAIVEGRIALTQALTKPAEPFAPVQVAPAVTMVVATAIPVEVFRDRGTPHPATGQPQPEFPIL